MDGFAGVRATPAERTEPRPGDRIVPASDVVMDRAFTVPGTPESVWPWIAQLGKARAGWYLPRGVERLIPPGRRALRRLDPRWTEPAVGQVIPDYGGRHETFTVAEVAPPGQLVYRSTRGRMALSWSIVLRDDDVAGVSRTRVLLRLRLAPVRRRWLARTAGEFFDALTILGLAAGLRERLVGRDP